MEKKLEAEIDMSATASDALSPQPDGHFASSYLVRVSRDEAQRESLAGAIDLADPYGRPSPGLSKEFQSGKLRIAYCLPSNRNAYRIYERKGDGTSGAAFALVLGWCYKVGEAKPFIDDSDCESMLDRLRRGVPVLDDSYSGNYVAILYDEASGRLVIQPDRWAVSGVFYRMTDHEIVVSNRLAAVANLAGAPIDGHSLLAQMRGTFPPFGRTIFAGVHRIMCGCYLSGDTANGRFQLLRAQPLYDPIEAYDRGQAVEALAAAFESVGARLRAIDGTLFDLSGGHDTRLVAASALSRDGDNSHFIARVFGDDSTRDAIIAKQIAAAVHCPLIRCDRPTLDAASREQLAASAQVNGGNLAFDVFCNRLAAEKAHIDGYEWLVGGIGGELVRGFFWAHEFLDKGRSPEVNYKALLDYRLYAHRDIDLALFGKPASYFEDNDDAILGPFKQVGDAGGELLNVYKLDAFYMHRLSYKVGDYHSVLFGLRNVIYPFLTQEIARPILTTPWEFRANRGMVLDTIARLNPTLSRIDNADGQPMQRLNASTAHRYAHAKAARLWRAAPRVIRRKLGGGGASKKGAVENRSPWLPLVENARHLDGLVDRDRLRHLIQTVAAGQSAGAVRCLHSLVMLELLIDQNPAIQREVRFEAGPDMLP